MTKKAVITGHSKGLGAALAAQLEASGYEVLGVSRSAGATVDLASPGAVRDWLEAGHISGFLADATDLSSSTTLAPLAPSLSPGGRNWPRSSRPST